MRVLIVDDNASMRQLLHTVLEGIAEIAGECDDGAGAEAAFEVVRPDCVLMDIRMSVVDGLEATRRLTAKHPDARVIIVTEYDDARARDAAAAAGAAGCVNKDDLVSLRRVLGASLSKEKER